VRLVRLTDAQTVRAVRALPPALRHVRQLVEQQLSPRRRVRREGPAGEEDVLANRERLRLERARRRCGDGIGMDPDLRQRHPELALHLEAYALWERLAGTALLERRFDSRIVLFAPGAARRAAIQRHRVALGSLP
jgi:hypothetical protein